MPKALIILKLSKKEEEMDIELFPTKKKLIFDFVDNVSNNSNFISKSFRISCFPNIV